MKIEEMKVGELIPYENNPRKNDAAVDAVAESIRRFGAKVPIIIDRNNVIVAGHTRRAAAIKLGMETFPVIMADDLTDEQIRAFRLADNKTGELAEWDFEKLEEELRALDDIDMETLGFEELARKNHEWFERNERWDGSREEGNESYNEFLDKFETKKTTDDCYTPENIYEVVAGWVSKEYGVDRKNFVRPFYPGGDYQNERYKQTDIVVDNPPFSILTEIVTFYTEKRIRFFLFAPGLSCFGHTQKEGVCAVCTNAAVTYENGARVNTSFLTNLGDGTLAAVSCPDLHEEIKRVNEANEKAMHRDLPKYNFPFEVMTAARLGYLAKYGQRFEIKRKEAAFIRTLDAMKDEGKEGIFGGALLMSERAAAERAAAETWKLSKRETEIVKSLGAAD